jgi:hypothetical protein
LDRRSDDYFLRLLIACYYFPGIALRLTTWGLLWLFAETLLAGRNSFFSSGRGGSARSFFPFHAAPSWPACHTKWQWQSSQLVSVTNAGVPCAGKPLRLTQQPKPRQSLDPCCRANVEIQFVTTASVSSAAKLASHRFLLHAAELSISTAFLHTWINVQSARPQVGTCRMQMGFVLRIPPGIPAGTANTGGHCGSEGDAFLRQAAPPQVCSMGPGWRFRRRGRCCKRSTSRCWPIRRRNQKVTQVPLRNLFVGLGLWHSKTLGCSLFRA